MQVEERERVAGREAGRELGKEEEMEGWTDLYHELIETKAKEEGVGGGGGVLHDAHDR